MTLAGEFVKFHHLAEGDLLILYKDRHGKFVSSILRCHVLVVPSSGTGRLILTGLQMFEMLILCPP